MGLRRFTANRLPSEAFVKLTESMSRASARDARQQHLPGCQILADPPGARRRWERKLPLFALFTRTLAAIRVRELLILDARLSHSLSPFLMRHRPSSPNQFEPALNRLNLEIMLLAVSSLAV